MTGEPRAEAVARKSTSSAVKCVVWDLDNTLWDGVLLEDPQVVLRPDVVEVIKTLDSRGILNSIASKNDHDLAMAKLCEFGVEEYFLYPQITWSSKSSSLEAIARAINIGIDTLAFVDDQAFEREEVAYAQPSVLCLDVADLATILDLPMMNPRFITQDSKLRRQMYLSDIARARAEQEYVGPSEGFLASLGMIFTIAPAGEGDLQRAEELTVRTNQLNTTGYTYSYEELDQLRQSPDHKLLMAGLSDTYGSYGKIGLALIACQPEVWTIKLLLMSCRVMSRGVGTIMMSHILQMAKAAGVRLQAEFVSNTRNRMMYITYKFSGFKEVEQRGEMTIFEHDLRQIQAFPPYVEVRLLD
ncbi:MAG TPA: HAD-IIIC family phosphatase [Herpetosiphonaceae bacterium]